MKKPYLCFFLILFILSCATQFTYYSTLRNFLSIDDYSKAESVIEENKLKEYKGKDELLYWLDKAIVLHYAGKYEDSIIAFEKAEKLAWELYTKSISEEITTLLISDNLRSYPGEDFEQVFINVFLALNYLFLKNMKMLLLKQEKLTISLKHYR